MPFNLPGTFLGCFFSQWQGGFKMADDGSGGIWGGMKIPVFGIAGEKFSGKTLLASTIDPTKTLMIDLEKSSESYSLPFKRRVDLYVELQRLAAEKGNLEMPTPQDAFLWFKATCEAIQPGEFTVLAVDPISDIESGLADWVRANPKMFGRTEGQYAKAGGLVWADVKAWWKMFLGMLSAKVETLVFTVHMGNEWKGAAPTTKRKPKGKETLFELASLYLQLERKADGTGKVAKEPSAIVLKSRLAKTTIKADGSIDIVPILPPRIDKATPKAIRDYIANPPDFAKLKKGERHVEVGMTDDERLEIGAAKAHDELETEQLKLSRIEMMRNAARDQSAARQSGGAVAVAAAAKQPEQVIKQPEKKAEVAPAVSASESDASFSIRTTCPRCEADREILPSGVCATCERAADAKPESDPAPHATIESQRTELGITDLQWAAILSKRGVTQSNDLTEEQAEAIRKTLWSKLTARDAGKA